MSDPVYDAVAAVGAVRIFNDCDPDEAELVPPTDGLLDVDVEAGEDDDG